MSATRYQYYDNESMFHGFIPHIMGTRFDILIIHPDVTLLHRIWVTITNELEYLDRILNRFDPKSEVSKINSLHSQNSIPISAELGNILQLCQYYYEHTFHLFDITLKDFSEIQFCNRHISFCLHPNSHSISEDSRKVMHYKKSGISSNKKICRMLL